MFNKVMKNKKGFTLVELLVIITIIGVLAAVIAPNVIKAIEKSKVAGATSDYKAIKAATLNFYADTGVWPVDNANAGGANAGFVQNVGSPPVDCRWNGPYLERWKEKNPWGGAYNFKIASGTVFGTAAADERYLELTNVPQNAWQQLRNDLGATVVKPDNFTAPNPIQILISRD
ncbi:MAG: prepilin-type N-terminal cleavage/methylation domain-containing protein [Desulfotomaculum sp.]|nr:prepilin-type N-terminal cleavage/methylation domain-containing protein [Desulfotomaculum sp.]